MESCILLTNQMPIMKLKHLLVGTALLALPLSGLVAPRANAQVDITGALEDVNDTAGFGNQPLEQTIGTLINVFLGLLGIIFLVLIIYAGFLWMTAAGDDGKVKTARGIMTTSVVGLVILLSAYAISSFVIEQLTTATGTG